MYASNGAPAPLYFQYSPFESEGINMDKFERVTCSRCHGSGSYSYCQAYGHTCFKCGGTKEVLTARGMAANRYFTELLSIPASQLAPGMKVRTWNMTNNGQIHFQQWYTVELIEPYDTTGNKSFVNGVEIPQRVDLLKIQCKGMGFHGVAPETLYRVAATAEEKQAALAKALAYQETLTQAGKPRVRTKAP